MNLSKIALAGAAVLGLVASGAAQAASTRAGAALPAPAAKAKKLSRTAAPAEGAANRLETTGIVLLTAGVGLAGVGIYEATKDDTPGS